MKLLLDDGNEHIGGYGAPDLRLHRVLARAQEFLDAQMLLDPFEEQLHLPAILVERGDRQRGQCCVVGEEYQRLARLGIFETDTAQMLGVVLADVEAVHGDGLIADHARGPVGCAGVNASGVHPALGSGDKEGTRLMQTVKPREIQIAPIHYVESPGLDVQEVEHIDLVHLAVADVDKGGNGATQVEQRVHLDRCLGRTKRRPTEQTQAQIDSCRIQGVDRVGQIQPQIFVAVELAGAPNEQSRQVGPDAPISRIVGIGQGGAVNGMTQPHRVELAGVGSQRDLDVAQTFAPSQLRKGHHAKLLRTVHAAHAGIARVAIHDARKARPRNELHHLCKQRLADIHGLPPGISPEGNYTKMRIQGSNRHQEKSAAKPRQYWLLSKLTPV